MEVVDGSLTKQKLKFFIENVLRQKKKRVR